MFHGCVTAETEPLSLQDTCRSSIRIILRHNVEVEHPNLKPRQVRIPKKKSVKKRTRQSVIPIFEESDNDEFGIGATDDEDGGDRNLGRAYVIYHVQRQRAGHITAANELAQNLACHRRSVRVQQQQQEQEHHLNDSNNTVIQQREDERMEETVDTFPDQEFEGRNTESMEAKTVPADKIVTPEKLQEEACVSSTVIPEQRKKIPKFDSGIGDETENGKGLSSDSDRDAGASMEVDSDSDFSDPLPSAGKRSHRSQNSGEKTSSRVKEFPHNSFEVLHKLSSERRAKVLMRKRLGIAADEESDEKSEEEMQEGPASNNMEVHDTSMSETGSYTTYMRSKIQALPLPPNLKVYINLYREF